MQKQIRERILLATAVLLVVLVSPLVAIAAEATDAHHYGPSIGQLLWPTINFFLYALVICYGYKRMAAPALKQQRVEVQQQFDKGRVELSEAQANLEWLQTQHRNIETEKAEVVAELEEEGRLLAAVVLEKAATEASYSRKDVERRILGEMSKVEAQLRATAIRDAAEKARETLRENVDAQRDAQLRRNAILQFRS